MKKIILVFIVVLLICPMVNSSLLLDISPTVISNGGPMDSAWPMFSHDPQRTGRSPFGIIGNVIMKKWEFQMEGSMKSSPAIDKDGTIYIGSTFGNYLFAINSDGTEKWRFKADYWIQSSPAIAEDGTIYVGSDDGKLYAINPNGTLKWKLHIGAGWSHSSPVIDDDGLIYIASVIGSNICAVYPNNGTKKWDYKTNGWIYSSPALDKVENILIGSEDGYFYSLNHNGSLKWKYYAGGWVGGASPAIDESGTVYFGSSNGYLYALYANGTLKWRFRTNSNIYSSPALGEDGTIVIGSYNNKIYCLDSNGSEKWNYTTEGWVTTSPVIDKYGVIYVGSLDGNLYVLNTDGTLKCRFQTGEHGEFWSSPIIGEDGTIYCAAFFNEPNPYSYLYALTLIENNPPNKPIITGQTNGKIGVKYEYEIYIEDPDGDDVDYRIDFDEGFVPRWLGLYTPSPLTLKYNKSWDYRGTYTIRAQAMDVYGAQSDWGILKVSMPKNKVINLQLFLQRFLHRFPLFEKILNQIL